MSRKYKVSQNHNGKTLVYGNFPAKTPEEAVQKAYDRNKDWSVFDFKKPFHVKFGSVEQDVMLNG